MVQTIRISAVQMLFALVIILSVVGIYAADNSPTLISWVVGAGGNTSTGGAYALSSTAGQTAVGRITGGAYTLNAGFWHINTDGNTVYRPLIQR